MACAGTSSQCSGVLTGQRTWRMERDKRGYKRYYITHRVEVDDTPGSADGPANALATPGLPIPGGIWDFDNDTDADAFFTQEAKVTPVIEGERCRFYDIEQVATSEPEDSCLTQFGTGVVDPLTEQPVISGSFVKYTELAEFDKDGDRILSKSFEKFRGPAAEFDKSRATIRITINSATLDLATLCVFIDTLNSFTLWGFDPRCVKLSDITWERKFYAGCSCYFAITYEFETKTDTFDRFILNEGTKALNGKWVPGQAVWELIPINGAAPDPLKPAHYTRYVDRFGNMARTLLKSDGTPAIDEAEASSELVEFYPDNDLETALGLPSSLECPA